MIKNNPFFSSIFTSIWNKHFNKKKVSYAFNILKDISFYKPTVFPLFVNTGKNLTKGVSYCLDTRKTDYISKCFLIYDVPQYFIKNHKELPRGVKLIRVPQYPGYITNLENFENFDEYISINFSKKSKYKFRSYKRALENTFDINYKHIYGEISKEKYDTIFNQFYSILSKRFDDKSETNNNLNPLEWAFYKEVVYPLIIDKKASLYVVYQSDKPIAISLNYFSEDILFFAITGFDIDFSKYNVGTVHLMELFKWCFDNDIKTFDFSKGHYAYKARWGDSKYSFENHIYYDSKSLFSSIIAHTTANYFRFKQYLRGKKIKNKLNNVLDYLKKS